MRLLSGGRLFPEPTIAAGGKGGYGLYDIEAVKHAAIIGAIHGAGVDLIAAARLAKEIVGLLTSRYAWIPDNSDYAARAEDPPTAGEAWRGDRLLTIADRKYVFLDSYHPKKRMPNMLEGPEFIIEDWERGGSMGILAIEDLIPLLDINKFTDEFPFDPDFKAEGDRIEREFRAARRKAVALLQINLSLACRNGLDRVTDYRAGKTARS